jgi:hypothetical protein
MPVGRAKQNADDADKTDQRGFIFVRSALIRLIRVIRVLLRGKFARLREKMLVVRPAHVVE